MKRKIWIVVFIGLLFIGLKSTNAQAKVENKNFTGEPITFYQEGLRYKLLDYKIIDNPLPTMNAQDTEGVERYIAFKIDVKNMESDDDSDDPGELVTYSDFSCLTGPNKVIAETQPLDYYDLDSWGETLVQGGKEQRLKPGEERTFKIFFVIYPGDPIKLEIGGSYQDNSSVISVEDNVSSNGVTSKVNNDDK